MPARIPLLKLPLLILLLALSALLLAAADTYAALPVNSGSTTLTFESLVEDEGEGEEEGDGGEEEGECESAQEEVEEGELTQAEADEVCDEEAEAGRNKKSGSAASEDCVLRSAQGEATTSGQGEKLKLTISYTAYEPVAAMLKIGHLDTVHRHLGRSGVLRLVESLHGHDSPKQVSVRIDIASTKSAGCPFRRLVLFPR